jgi:hypothetical protein
MTKLGHIPLIIAIAISSTLPSMAQQKRISPHETISTVIGDRRTGDRITIIYGRPYSKDPKTGDVRVIWGTLVPYDKPWRMGADEATLFITQQPIAIGDTTIPAGAYTLYLVPEETGPSKLAFSTAIGKWGIPVDVNHDLARVDATREPLDPPLDQYAMAVTKDSSGTGGTIKLMWEKTQFSVSFTVKK